MLVDFVPCPSMFSMKTSNDSWGWKAGICCTSSLKVAAARIHSLPCALMAQSAVLPQHAGPEHMQASGWHARTSSSQLRLASPCPVQALPMCHALLSKGVDHKQASRYSQPHALLSACLHKFLGWRCLLRVPGQAPSGLHAVNCLLLCSPC